MSKQEFFIRAGGQRIEVTEEVYLTYYRSKRRERYLDERDTVQGKVLYSNMDTDEMTGEDMLADLNATSVEDSVMQSLMTDELYKALDKLPEPERALIKALFFQGMTERQAAATFGLSQKGIHKRKIKILSTLRKILEN